MRRRALKVLEKTSSTSEESSFYLYYTVHDHRSTHVTGHVTQPRREREEKSHESFTNIMGSPSDKKPLAYEKVTQCP